MIDPADQVTLKLMQLYPNGFYSWVDGMKDLEAAADNASTEGHGLRDWES